MTLPGRASPDTGRGLAALLALLLLLITAAATAQTSRPEFKPNWGETLLLALKVNGVLQDSMLRAVRLSEGLAIPQSNWDELHLRLPTGSPPRVIDGEQHVLLAAAGPLRWHIDEATQTLEIDAPASAFVGQSVDTGPALPRVTQPSVWAPFINYDAEWQARRTATGSHRSADALWEAGLFSPLAISAAPAWRAARAAASAWTRAGSAMTPPGWRGCAWATASTRPAPGGVRCASVACSGAPISPCNPVSSAFRCRPCAARRRYRPRWTSTSTTASDCRAACRPAPSTCPTCPSSPARARSAPSCATCWAASRSSSRPTT